MFIIPKWGKEIIKPRGLQLSVSFLFPLDLISGRQGPGARVCGRRGTDVLDKSGS